MEILSIGEKIKRARIYKGYTLKDLCDGKISVSKMSCIENDKVGLEPEVLDFIVDKLDLDIEYLKEDVEQQIRRNISNCDYRHGNEEYEKNMLYNLEIAQTYEYYDVGFEIMHILFCYFINFKFEDKLRDILAQYYEMCLKSQNEENKLIYNMDMGEYLYENKEYAQAANYFQSLRKKTYNKLKYSNYLIESILKEVNCYIMLRNFEKAIKLANSTLDYKDDIDDNKKMAEVYHLIAILMLRTHKAGYKGFEEKSEMENKEDFAKQAENKLDYSKVFFENSENKNAVEYLNSAMSIFPREDKLLYAKFSLNCIKLLIDNGEFEVANNFYEDSLNCAIGVGDDELIERAYYYKSLLLYKQNNFVSAEMYINLSLDVLTKCGSRNEIYERYMDIGNLYSKCGAISDSLKYFSLAIALEKKF